MANNLKETGNSTNWPTLSERDWYVISICLALGAAIAALFAAIWVFEASTVRAMKARLDLVTPFGAIYLALVTFSTVAWRGMVTSRQADQQMRQNDANDEANYSKLLQEAAKLIAEQEKLPQVVAGISTLEILITEPKQRYGVEAMDLLGDLLLETYGDLRLDRINRAVIRALSVGNSKGLTARLDAHFKREPATQSNAGRWTHIPGMRSLEFSGGTMTDRTYERSKHMIKRLNNVRLIGCSYEKHITYIKCHFHGCRISAISDLILSQHTFTDCDFSGVVIDILIDDDFTDLKLHSRRNYYKPNSPPVDQDNNSVAHFFMSEEEYNEAVDDLGL